tara:strand:- start:350 stop:775 length:426 start_codon:yes stop_codon:yes gene_type:complete
MVKSMKTNMVSNSDKSIKQSLIKLRYKKMISSKANTPYKQLTKEKTMTEHEKNITIKFVDNQKHGYVQVSKYDLEGWNIDTKQFSSYSFYNDNNACYYLEEDCDGYKLHNILTKMGYIINYAKNYVALNYMNDPIFKRINN